MTTIDPPRPRSRAFWSDARFLIGIVLIVASIAAVWFVVDANRRTVPVFAAAATLVPGQVITAQDLRVVDVTLGAAGDAYLAPDEQGSGRLRDGAVATRTIEADELVPTSAVAAAASSRVTTVVITSATDVPSAVAEGAVVEVWSAPVLEGGGYATPAILIADATVAAVTTAETMIGGGASTLELVIERADVAKTLEAVAAGSALSVVPVTAGR